MIILRFLSKLINVLRAGPSPVQIAGGFTLGMFLGMMPVINLYSLLIVIIIIMISVNISAAILGWMVFTLFAYLLDPVFHDIGYYFLVQTSWLQDFWTYLYNLPVFPLTKFNNTVVLGSLLLSLCFAIPIFILARIGIIQYRERLDTKIQNLKMVKIVKGTKLYGLYERIKNLGE